MVSEATVNRAILLATSLGLLTPPAVTDRISRIPFPLPVVGGEGALGVIPRDLEVSVRLDGPEGELSATIGGAATLRLSFGEAHDEVRHELSFRGAVRIGWSTVRRGEALRGVIRLLRLEEVDLSIGGDPLPPPLLAFVLDRANAWLAWREEPLPGEIGVDLPFDLAMVGGGVRVDLGGASSDRGERPPVPPVGVAVSVGASALESLGVGSLDEPAELLVGPVTVRIVPGPNGEVAP
jgi:hypothetical protein